MDRKFVNDFVSVLNDLYGRYVNTIYIGSALNSKDNKVTVNLGLKENFEELYEEDYGVFDDSLTEGEISIFPKVIMYDGNPYTINTYRMNVSSLGCFDDTSYYSWLNSGTPPDNRDEIRPVMGGVSCTNYSTIPTGRGTLGFLALDNETNSVVGVSAAHVLVKDPFLASNRTVIGPQSIVENDWNSNIGQPGNEFDLGDYIDPQEEEFLESIGQGLRIGTLKKYIPLIKDSNPNPEYTNRIDAAAFAIDEYDDFGNIITKFLPSPGPGFDGLNTNSYQQLNIPSTEDDYGTIFGTYGFKFGSTEEIDSLILSEDNLEINELKNLYISSRTTGAKGSTINKIYPIGQGQTTINYYSQGSNNISSTITDVVFFVVKNSDEVQDGLLSTVCPYPVADGDSGAAVIYKNPDELNSPILGMVIGGITTPDIVFDPPYNNSYSIGVFCRIDNISEDLDISNIWAFNFLQGGGGDIAFSDNNSILTHYEPGLSSEPYMVINGKKYWQVGITW